MSENLEELKKLKQNIEELDGKIRLIEKEISKQAKGAIYKAFQPFFDKIEGLESVYWTQYTPSWNDGDPCYFGRNDICVMINDEELDGHDDIGNEDFGEALKILESLPEHWFEEIFGNDAKVTITKDGIEVEDYDHGY